MKRRLYTLDVFTNTPFAGNPLAVVTDGDGLSARRMQDIAREMNLSETVFVQKPTSAQALARLRIFTTQNELRLAGHPVIGTWFLLAQLGVVPAQEGPVHIWQQTGAGVLPIEISFRDGRPVRVTMLQKPAEFKSARLSKPALVRALGLKPGDLNRDLPIESVSTGIFNLMVPLANRRALARISADPRALLAAMRGADSVAYCFVLASREQVFSRGMLPWAVYEDPATGSAGGSLAAYLVRHGKLRIGERITIAQGLEMGRPSRIEAVVEEQRGKLVPRVSGAAVVIFEGFIEA
ncbi:MAG TPA: PhzF family phenazine biosynthesis protein [Candidatus Acidoferrales bacterium]|nr:PhzF family phenazine biosynthesis protein [Candidatus Acidoferrales bacterium]